MADLNRFRRLGQQFTQEGQDLIRRNIDEPIQDMRQRVIDAQAVEQMKALRSAQQPQPMAPSSPQSEQQLGAVTGPDFNSVMSAMDAQIELNRRDKAMRQQMEMEDQARKLEEIERAGAQYQPYRGNANEMGALNDSEAQRFARLKQALQPQPQQQGAIELSMDPEEMQRQIEKAHRGQ